MLSWKFLKSPPEYAWVGLFLVLSWIAQNDRHIIFPLRVKGQMQVYMLPYGNWLSRHQKLNILNKIFPYLLALLLLKELRVYKDISGSSHRLDLEIKMYHFELVVGMCFSQCDRSTGYIELVNRHIIRIQTTLLAVAVAYQQNSGVWDFYHPVLWWSSLSSSSDKGKNYFILGCFLVEW